MKFNNLGIFQSLKLRILLEKILSISLKLNFNPNTFGCKGLSLSKTVENTDAAYFSAAGPLRAESSSNHPSFHFNVQNTKYEKFGSGIADSQDHFRDHKRPSNFEMRERFQG